MSNIYEFAEKIFQPGSIDEKLRTTHEAWQLCSDRQLTFEPLRPPNPIELTRFPERPKLLLPKFMPKRDFNSAEGIAAFFHALAHIEFIAIYLAWDILYRFRALPEQFYQDWLKIADEEAQHFELLSAHLHTLGVSYGDLPAHHGLWEHAVDTSEHLLARLALVPRCLEARGLDVTPKMLAKFKASGDIQGVALLTRILTDEIGHVERGSYWFNFFCNQHNLDAELHFRELLNKYYKGGKPKGPFNRDLRIIAGFSTAELDWLENISI
jgi:uncharacterized ferritin-like protein (DUF455 family)